MLGIHSAGMLQCIFGALTGGDKEGKRSVCFCTQTSAYMSASIRESDALMP